MVSTARSAFTVTGSFGIFTRFPFNLPGGCLKTGKAPLLGRVDGFRIGPAKALKKYTFIIPAPGGKSMRAALCFFQGEP